MHSESAIARIRESIRELQVQVGLDWAEWSEDDMAAALHLMNTHKVDQNAALDQTSRGPNDYGIDAWMISAAGDTIWIYQSKLTDNKKLALKGIADLSRSAVWVEKVLTKNEVSNPKMSPAIFNLTGSISKEASNIKNLHFVLLTTMSSIENSPEFTECLKKISKSYLKQFLSNRGGSIEVSVENYNTKRGITSFFKKYQVEKIQGTKIDLRDGSHLGISYIPLINLVRLYRERGDVLFDKNVRLSLLPFQKTRVLHPMEETLEAICEGRLEPEIFPFYHVGVTVSADIEIEKGDGLFDLEGPAVVNGCQTITIANHFYEKLEKTKSQSKLERFSKIPVLAKIVIGTTAEELREITNCNNRQNPIELWQLFSNEEMQIRIEVALKDYGVFYERQKGKLESIQKRSSFAADFPNTNNSSITIPVLAQVLCFFQDRIQWAAKFSEVFTKEENYKAVFNETVLTNIKDVLFAINLWRAAKRGLLVYQQENEQYSQDLFKRPIIRAHLQQLAIAYVWQKKYKHIEEKFKLRLNKAAPPGLVEICYDFYPKVLAKTKRFYKEHEDGVKEVDITKRTKFFQHLATEIGVDISQLPFNS